MKMVLVAVRDRASDCFAQPMFVQSVGIAHRSFADEINREAQDNQLYKHPEDFDLYHMGFYDDNTGKFEQEEVRMIAVGKDLVRSS